MGRTIDTVFNGIAAVSTLAVACMAAWALIFTSLPDALVRQLQTDIADAREEVVDLRQERRQLRDEVSGMRARLEELQVEVHQTEAERQAISDELANLKAQADAAMLDLASIEQDRRTYLDQLMAIVVDDIIENLRRNLDAQRTRIQQLASLPADLDWLERAASYEELILEARSQEDWQEVRRLMDEQSEGMPVFWLMWRGSGWTTAGDPRATLDEVIAQHIDNITVGASEPEITGQTFLDAAISSSPMHLLLPKDREDFLARLREFSERHSDILSRPLSARLPIDWTEDYVLQESSAAMQNIAAVEDLLHLLRVNTLGLVSTDAEATDQP